MIGRRLLQCMVRPAMIDVKNEITLIHGVISLLNHPMGTGPRQMYVQMMIQ